MIYTINNRLFDEFFTDSFFNTPKLNLIHLLM